MHLEKWKKIFSQSLILTVALFTSILLTAASLEALNIHIFLDNLSQPAPSWMEEQIDEDLSPFTTELSKSSLDDLFQKDMCLIRIRVSNGVMTVEKNNRAATHVVSNSIIPHFYGLNHAFSLPDLDILVSPEDGIGCRPNGPALPIFAISKCKEDKGVIAMPDWFALQGYEPDKSMVLSGNKAHPWETKREMIFFRGGDTGVMDNSSFATWKQSPRPHLVELSLEHSDLIDARFSGGIHSKQYFENAQKEGFIGYFVPLIDYVFYKYLIDLDGNCASAPRLALIMHSNCVCMKAVTNQMQWFYKALKPNVHYIPLKEDLSDLISQLQWAKDHQNECLQISHNAQNLAKDVLSREAIYEYLYRLLVEYSKRQRVQYQ